MKLFQRLLVAPAFLSLLSPIAANANEFNLDGILNYYEDEVEYEIEINSDSFNNSAPSKLLAGGEGLLDTSDYGGGFSETTTATFSADMYLGSVNGGTSVTDDALSAAYSFQIDLNTSFTGEDSFDVSIDAGNSGIVGVSEFDGNTGGDGLVVDGIAYTLPLGEKSTVFFGDGVDGSSLYNTACVYGGPSNTLDDCGNVNSAMGAGKGTAAGYSYDIGNGFTAALGYTGDGSSSNGLLTKEGDDTFGGQISYSDESYGASITYANVEGTDDTKYWGFNGFWTPSEIGVLPSISLGYELGYPTSAKQNSSYFVGLQWDEVGAGTLGTALGTTTPTTENSAEFLMYEIFYSYPFNDGMSITPLVYLKEKSGTTDNETGIMIKTSFSF